MVLCVIPELTTGLIEPTQWIDALQQMHWHVPFDLAKLGDTIIEDNLWSSVQKAFNNFVKTGQVWAFLIGIIFGYLAKSFTTYG